VETGDTPTAVDDDYSVQCAAVKKEPRERMRGNGGRGQYILETYPSG